MSETANLKVDGKEFDYPVMSGTVGPDVIDIRKLYAQTDNFTYDPGFTSTASCQSKLTYIDGDAGTLLHRGYTIGELAEGSNFLFSQRPLAMDDAAASLLQGEASAILVNAHAELDALDKWDTEALEGAVRRVAEARGVKLGQVAQPLRAALTGRKTSPGIFDVLDLLGRDESLGRIADRMAS